METSISDEVSGYSVSHPAHNEESEEATSVEFLLCFRPTVRFSMGYFVLTGTLLR